MPTPRTLALSILVALSALSDTARAQFGAPAQQPVRERLVGDLLSAEGAPTPEAGDQIGVFFGDQVIGVFQFTGSTAGIEFNVVVNGDDPETDEKEGPNVGDRITFRFFDSSANTIRTDVVAENTQGERFNLTFQGQLVPAFPPGIPIDLTPVREINARVGVTAGGGGGDGPGDERGKYDINGDGDVDTDDAAVILRAIALSRQSGAGQRADVNGDGVIDDTDGDIISTPNSSTLDVNGDNLVTTLDAIEVMRNR